MDTTLIETEVERLRGELNRLEEERRALESKITPVRQEFDHWSGILNLRQARSNNGNSSASASAQTNGAVPAPAGGEEPQQEYGAKARAMRAFVISQNSAGVTMRQLLDAAAKISPHTAFAYQFVKRQLKNKRLEKRGKKFYATELLTLD